MAIEPLPEQADLGDTIRWCANVGRELRECRIRHETLSGLVKP